MSTRRLVNGTGVVPDKDLALLRRMAAQGHRLVRLSPWGQWVFEAAAPEDVDVAFAHLDPLDDDAVEVFRAAGWEPVCQAGRLHVFRAPAGTPPVHSESASLRDELHDVAVRGSRVAGAATALMLVAALVLWRLGAPPVVTATALAVLCVPVVFSGLPALATWRRLQRLS